MEVLDPDPMILIHTFVESFCQLFRWESVWEMRNHDTDPDGWQYDTLWGTDFTAEIWASDVVRRRRWERKMVRPFGAKSIYTGPVREIAEAAVEVTSMAVTLESMEI